MNDDLKNNLIQEFKNRFPSKKFVPGESPIPVSGKVFNEKEILKMTEAVLDGHWTDGKYAK